MGSIWSDTVQIKAGNILKEDISADNVIIGGGIVGILTAYHLKKKGRDAIILEAARLCSGQTKNTTAKITLQHGLIYHHLIEKAGREQAALYAEANHDAIAEYKKIIREKGIECQFRECSSYLYTLENEEKLIQEAEAAKALGISAEYTLKTELPFEVKGALCFYDQAVFHPLLFLEKIADDIKVYENTRVLTVNDNEIITERHKIKAKNIIFATHYPFINVPGFYFIRMHQERSYVLALKDTKQMDNIYYGVDKGGLSFRKSGDLMLLGGGNHRTGENKEGGKYRDLCLQAEKLFPGSREVCRWSAQDCMSVDNIPYIGKYAADRPDWYVATGFRKWGMTSSMVAARVISALIEEGVSQYEELFTPKRLMLQASAAHLLEEGIESAKGLSKGIFSAVPRCPHMGCALEWNPDELSWDCTCHGSRFDINGNLIDNPAQTGLEDK